MKAWSDIGDQVTELVAGTWAVKRYVNGVELVGAVARSAIEIAALLDTKMIELPVGTAHAVGRTSVCRDAVLM